MQEIKKNILFIHPDLRGGGAEKVLVNLLNTLDRNRYTITLLTIFEEGVNKKLLESHIEHKVIFKKVFRGWSIIQKLFTPEYLFKKLVKKDYDIIVAYLEGVPTRIVGGCTNPKTKIISWVHVDLTNFSIDKVFRSKSEMAKIYNRYNAIVGVSKTAMNSLQQIVTVPETKCHVIHNVVDTKLILRQGAEPIDDITVDREIMNLCSVGRLTRQKGYGRLMSIVKKLAEEGFKFHLYIIGQGELEQDLKKTITKFHIQKYVTLLGFKSNPHKYVKQSDLFVCSSYEEGFSTAVTESVILGTPVITTDCAGMEEILENGDVGMIVENNTEDLYAGLKKLFQHQKLVLEYNRKTFEKSKILQGRNNTVSVEKLFQSNI